MVWGTRPAISWLVFYGYGCLIAFPDTAVATHNFERYRHGISGDGGRDGSSEFAGAGGLTIRLNRIDLSIARANF